MQEEKEYSSKNASVVLHTPVSLFDVYGKPYGVNYPRELLPLRYSASGLLVSTIPSSGIFCTVVLLRSSDRFITEPANTMWSERCSVVYSSTVRRKRKCKRWRDL